ncbi:MULTISPECIES: acyl carrier protein [unclassified Corynebacterium]|uniref:acyl carrier protein n=1 Tax=unclassified Corynebacterium TaxID=2624378 RepID=UPI002648518A|nr:acyl carrier protein [Corynebacterium sp.]MDN5720286.1 acyl carrier protein [Corynebacterium sp.]MDN6324608.1 acyl carrier protein [Corynebacterium sp.]MDN6386832.1 acyl carrier protein [Corynebacterium sp.]MDN6510690.1 acyl carrier protein [Corynebacterium sp.]
MEISPDARDKLAEKLGGEPADDAAKGSRPARNARSASVDPVTRISMIIEDATGVDVEEISADSDLTDDLHIDSVSRIDIAIRIEDAFGVRVEEEDLDSARTVRDIVRFVEARSTTDA